MLLGAMQSNVRWQMQSTATTTTPKLGTNLVVQSLQTHPPPAILDSLSLNFPTVLSLSSTTSYLHPSPAVTPRCPRAKIIKGPMTSARLKGFASNSECLRCRSVPLHFIESFLAPKFGSSRLDLATGMIRLAVSFSTYRLTTDQNT